MLPKIIAPALAAFLLAACASSVERAPVSSIHLGAGLVGLLGSDVLSTFGKVTIDYNAQQAFLG